VEVQIVDGKRGELTVLLDGVVVAKRRLMLFKPSAEKVLAAVRASSAATAGPNT
jgi:hypothetical protein